MPFRQWVNPLYDGIVSSKVTLDRAGRVVLPKTLRDEMRLSPGDTLDIAVKGEELTLRPRRGATALQKERGVWVLRTDTPLTADEAEETLRNIRTQRHRRNAGESQ
jgi:AbrB family looped-hinge helix DNA binding protein